MKVCFTPPNKIGETYALKMKVSRGEPHGNCHESVSPPLKSLDSKASLGISSSSLLLPTSKLDEVDQSRHDMEISMALIWYMDNVYIFIDIYDICCMSWNAKSIFPLSNRWRLSFIDSLSTRLNAPSLAPSSKLSLVSQFLLVRIIGEAFHHGVCCDCHCSRDFLHPSTYKVRKKMAKQIISSDDFSAPKKK